MTVSLIIAGIVLCIAFSAFFSASEMSLSSANIIRLENEAKAGNSRAKKAVYIEEHFDDSLSAILIGNNLVNIAASSLASVLVILLTGEDTLTWIATTVITILVIIFGESIPKIAAKKNANRFSLVAAPFVRALLTCLKPLVKLVVLAVHAITSGIKDEDEEESDEEAVAELQSIIETAEDEGVLDEDQSELLQAAIEFKDISAIEVMTARVDVEAIDIDDSLEEILQQVEDSPYSRFPVYEESLDNIIGTLHLNHLYKALAESEEVNIRNILLEPVYVYKTMKLPTILKTLKEAKRHLAVVTDEYSGTIGIVSFEDVIEEIVGEIWDESDTIEDEIIQTGKGEYEIDADMIIDDFRELLELTEDEFECDSETVGGWIIEFLERFPQKGDSFVCDISDKHLEVTVLEETQRRIEKVKIVVK